MNPANTHSFFFVVRLALLAGLLLAAATARAQDVVIVANKTLSVPTLTAGQLRDIFIGTRTRLADGSHIVPVALKGGPVQEVFLRKHVGDNPDEYRARWRKAVFTGQGTMIKEFVSESTLLEYIAATPGAIGYVSRVDDRTDVKVLTISR